MNKEEIKARAIEYSKELKSGLILANRFNGLDVYVGGYDSYMELGSIAACVAQIGKPFIFLADSKILTKYRLTKKDIKAILYHEQGHYELGHVDIDNIQLTYDEDEAKATFEKQELDADAKAIELAVQQGANIEDALLTLAMALSKIICYVMEEYLDREELVNEECIDFIARRIDTLTSRLSNEEAYTQRMDRLRKQMCKSLLKVVNKHGFDSVDEMICSIKENSKEDEIFNFNIADAELDQATLYGLENILLDNIDSRDMDNILDDIWNN